MRRGPAAAVGAVGAVGGCVLAVAAAGVLAASGARASDPPPGPAHPNPSLSSLRVDYALTPRGPNGKPTSLRPLLKAVIKQALADQDYLAYQTRGDLGGFVPAQIGHLALSGGGHAVVGAAAGKTQIPHYAQAGGGRITSFALTGSSPPTTSPDNGRQPLPGVGVPPQTPPATGNGAAVPPANQGFGGNPPPTATAPGTATQAAPPGATTSRTSPPRAATRPQTTTTGATSGTTTTGTTTSATTTAATTTTPTTTGETTTAATTTEPTTTVATVVTTTVATTTRRGATTTAATTTTASSGASCGTAGMVITSDHSSCEIDASNMAPGGVASEVLTIRNTTSQPFTVSLRATGTQNRLWNDLQLGVWQTGTAAPNPLPPLLDWTTQDNDLAISPIQPGQSVRITVELALPSTAGNADQNLTATIDFVWKARA